MKKDIDFIPRSQQDRALVYIIDLLEQIVENTKPQIKEDKTEAKVNIKKEVKK